MTYEQYLAELAALGPEPPTPSSASKRFGTRGIEGAKPENVAQWKAEQKALRNYRAKLRDLAKRCA